MSVNLDRVKRAKLAKLCEMFRSNFDGERATAAAMATALLRDAGLTWSELLITPAAPTVAPGGHPIGWREIVRRCRAKADCLSSWERDFLANLDRLPLLSLKQAARLREIADRVIES